MSGQSITHHNQKADFRSDTVTCPTKEMRLAIAEAEVGDDVYGDDETVSALERRTATLLGKEAGLFVASGTQSNLIALLTHLARGEEYLAGAHYHTIHYEAGGASALGGAIGHPLPQTPTGGLRASDIVAAIKDDDPHFPITRLLSLENTVSGMVQDYTEMAELSITARQHGLNVHLDGARLMNAVVASGRPAADYASLCDTVSLCLSKGLGAPVGSVLVGDTPFIHRARRLRKMVGGGMRQAGILAAAGLFALDHHIDRLAEDHRHAAQVATALAELPDIDIDLSTVQTNMVLMRMTPEKAAGLKAALADQNITISPASRSGDKAQFRLVFHLDIAPLMAEKLVDGVTRHLKAA